MFLYILSRLPLLSLGYGVDGDSWRIARSGIEFITNGKYSPSRFPGYPFMEMLAGIFSSPFAMNFVVAIFGLLAIFSFKKICEQLNIADRTLTAIFAFMPIFWSFSATTMDYVPAMALSLFAIYLMFANKPVSAGFFFGLALCFRAHTAILLPVLIHSGFAKKGWKSLCSLIPVGILAFGVYGYFWWIGGIPRLDSFGTPNRLLFAVYRAMGAFGGIGSIFIVISVAVSLSKNHFSFCDFQEKLFLFSFIPFLIFWFTLPHESGYWIILMPFIILLLNKLDKSYKTLLLILFVITSFIDIYPITREYDKYVLKPSMKAGIVLNDYRTRKKIIRARNEIPKIALTEKDILITGRGASFFILNPLVEPFGEICGPDAFKSKISGAILIEGLTRNCVDSLIMSGYEINILDTAIPSNRLIYGWTPENLDVRVIKNPAF